MLRTERCKVLRVELPARSKALAAICFCVVSFGLSTVGQSEKTQPDHQQVTPSSSNSTPTTAPFPSTGDPRVSELASRIATAATEEAADSVLMANRDVIGLGLGRALVSEIIQLRNSNASGEKVLAVASRSLRYSKLPEMRDERGFAHRGAGIAYLYLRRSQLAEKELLTALAIFRRGGDIARQQIVLTSLDLAALYSLRKEHEATIEHYRTARDLAASIGDIESEIRAYYGLSSVYFQKNDSLQGDAYLEKTISLADTIKDKTLKETILEQGASFFMSQGRISEAVAAYETAHRIAAESDSPKRVDYLFQSALAHIKLGDFSTAYSHLRKVQSESAESDDRRLYIYSLLNIAWIYKQTAQEGNAIKLYQRVAVLADSEISSRPDKRAYVSARIEALNRLAEIHAENGETQAALELYAQNLKLLQAVRGMPETEPRLHDADLAAEIGINISLGELQSSLGNNAEAMARFSAALELAEKNGYESGSIDALLGLARYAARLGDPQKASSYVNKAEVLVHRNRQLDQSLKLHTISAGVHRRLNRPAAADLAFQQAVRISESLRIGVLPPSQRASYFASLFSPFDDYIDFLMERHAKEPDAGFDRKAFNVSERRRARALLDSLREARTDIRHGVDPALLEQETRLRSQLNALAREHSTLDLRSPSFLDDDPLGNPVTRSKPDIAGVAAELARVETAIRQKSPRYAELMQPRTLRWEAVQTLLDEKTILLNYTLGEKRSFLWTITQDDVRSYILPPRTEIEVLVKAAYTGLSENPGERQPSTSSVEATDILSKILLEPAVEALGKKRTVVIVADGALHYLPFSSLTDPRTRTTTKQPILVSNEILFAPSASVVAVLRQEAERRPIPARTVAIFADPVFSAQDERLDGIIPAGTDVGTRTAQRLPARDLFISRFTVRADGTGAYRIPRLPFSRREADAIFSNTRPETSFRALDFDASREMMASTDLSRFGIVHFATHGLLDSEYPELSGVVLSLFNRRGEPVDGFVRLNEIYNMKLNADLVVLSACQTALGKDVRGEGLIGLTRGFMYAGSPRVLASLWKVDDVATAELMKSFYQKILKENMRPALALRAAKIEMMQQKRWSSPYFWAAFELQGEWQ